MAFCVATCPACSKQFRLRWRIGKKKLPLSAVVRLACPTCSHSFGQVAGELVVFEAGKEEFPRAVSWIRSALVGGSPVSILRGTGFHNHDWQAALSNHLCLRRVRARLYSRAGPGGMRN